MFYMLYILIWQSNCLCQIICWFFKGIKMYQVYIYTNFQQTDGQKIRGNFKFKSYYIWRTGFCAHSMGKYKWNIAHLIYFWDFLSVTPSIYNYKHVHVINSYIFFKNISPQWMYATLSNSWMTIKNKWECLGLRRSPAQAEITS